MRAPTLLLLQLLLGYGLASVGFLFGVPIGPWQFWVTLAATVGAAFLSSRRTGFVLLALEVPVALLTFFTFTYTHIDASIFHLPLSHFLVDGWNPVREGTVETVRALFAAHGVADIENSTVFHMLVDPKFGQILAAQFQSAFGLFTALGYPMWSLHLVLGVTAYRFARAVWKASAPIAVGFAALMGANPIIAAGSFGGMADLVTYDAVATAALALGLWKTSRRAEELVVFFGAIVVSLVSKFSGIPSVAVLLALAAVLGWRERAMRLGALVFVLSLAVFCILPYWTWQSPPVDLTSNFGGNADAERMGFCARFVYAWVSKPLAVWGCKVYYGLASFNPVWPVSVSTGGESPLYRAVLWSGAILALVLRSSRRQVAIWIAWTLLLTLFLLPVKYTGYTRYVAQVHAVVVLLWFGIAFALPRRPQLVLLACCGIEAVLYFKGFVGDWIGQLRDEGVRQRNLETIATSGTPYEVSAGFCWWKYDIAARMAFSGVRLSETPTGRKLKIGWMFRLEGEGLDEGKGALFRGADARFPSPLRKRRGADHFGHDPAPLDGYPPLILQSVDVTADDNP